MCGVGSTKVLLSLMASSACFHLPTSIRQRYSITICVQSKWTDSLWRKKWDREHQL